MPYVVTVNRSASVLVGSDDSLRTHCHCFQIYTIGTYFSI